MKTCADPRSGLLYLHRDQCGHLLAPITISFDLSLITTFTITPIFLRYKLKNQAKMRLKVPLTF